MAISKNLQDKLALLPDSPGCYIMKDENGEILYVGKAKVLKNRVRSYFHGTHNYKTTKLVSKIRDFEFICTASEKESLLLEINLIKKHRPPFNIMLMDDTSYPYIAISRDQNFTVRVIRKIKNKTSNKEEYFGPYPSSSSASEMVRLINQLFPIRKCTKMAKQPCLYYHIHQCLGPCFQQIDPNVLEDYKKRIRRLLQGDAKELLDMLQAQMLEASENLQFEKAQDILTSIQAIENVLEKQTIDFKDSKSRDVFGYYEEKGYISFQGFFIRRGQLLARNQKVMPVYEDNEDAFSSYILQYYENNIVPAEILVPEGTDCEALSQALDTKVRIPVRGEKKKLVDLVLKNAQEAHEQKFQMVFRKNNQIENANEQLSQLLGADIHTIEIFDNSHIQGTFNVSGLVTFKDGVPDKQNYRHYKLDGYRSDIDSMKEVIYRRYFRLLREQKKMPDLLIVDGGAQQILAAKEIKDMLDLNLRLCGLVKDDKHSTRALMNEDLQEIPLSKESELFFMLTRMQDEVHRFAISYHRKLRDKSMTVSVLDTIEGVGEIRRKALIKEFKSMKRIKEASVEELEKVVPRQVAENIYNRLHDVL
ncbi:MAG: excinuclease ABC subunit UvrC [Firmicutes bacterium]|nr:excinuclease ABC subunit UvrC [Bacillota bacterium]